MVPYIPPPTLKEVIGGWKGGIKLLLGAFFGAILLYVFFVLGLGLAP
jgi:hypothetical protein